MIYSKGENHKDTAWYSQRKYLHFDCPVSLESALKVVSVPSQVTRRSFYPFISYTSKTSKVFRNIEGELEKKLKPRKIAYASHLDAHIYAYYSRLLSEKYDVFLKESGIDGSVIAFRSLGKSNIGFAAQAFKQIKNIGDCIVVCMDVKGFFDNLNHGVIKEKWGFILGEVKLPQDHFAVFKSITKWSEVNKKDAYRALDVPLHRNGKKKIFRLCEPSQFREKIRLPGIIKTNTSGIGIPQGSPISALISNIYMIDFDKAIADFVFNFGGYYYRYCDDIIIIISSANLDGSDLITSFVGEELKKIFLKPNCEKTNVSTFSKKNELISCDKPIQYLGFVFDGEKIIIRSASLSRFSDRMKRGVHLAKNTMRKMNKKKVLMGIPQTELYKKKLYARYSHLGKRNFIRYGLRAADELGSQSIRKQLRPLWKRLKVKIDGD